MLGPSRRKPGHWGVFADEGPGRVGSFLEIGPFQCPRELFFRRFFPHCLPLSLPSFISGSRVYIHEFSVFNFAIRENALTPNDKKILGRSRNFSPVLQGLGYSGYILITYLLCVLSKSLLFQPWPVWLSGRASTSTSNRLRLESPSKALA